MVLNCLSVINAKRLIGETQHFYIRPFFLFVRIYGHEKPLSCSPFAASRTPGIDRNTKQMHVHVCKDL